MTRFARWTLGGWIVIIGVLVIPMTVRAQHVQGLEKTGRIARLEAALGALKYPMAVRIGPGKDRYVLDGGNGRLLVIGNNGKVKHNWPLDTAGKSQFEAAADIAIDKSGNVYVADAANSRIVKYSGVGKRLLVIGKPGEINGPLGLAVTDDGSLIVADTNGHSVVVYDPTGKLVRRFGSEGTGPGNLRYPHGIALDAKGNIYVADFLNDRVSVFDPKGTPVRTFGGSGKDPGKFRNPYGLAIDHKGRVWVSDSENARIQVFSAEGTEPQVLASPGPGAEAFDHPKSVAVAPDGEVIVCNTGKHAADLFRYKNP